MKALREWSFQVSSRVLWKCGWLLRCLPIPWFHPEVLFVLVFEIFPLMKFEKKIHEIPYQTHDSLPLPNEWEWVELSLSCSIKPLWAVDRFYKTCIFAVAYFSLKRPTRWQRRRTLRRKPPSYFLQQNQALVDQLPTRLYC